MFPVKPRENVIPIDNEIEAKFLETVLKDRDIPYVFISHHDTAFNGIYQMDHGWGYVEVPEERVVETKQLYEEVKRSRPGEVGDTDKNRQDRNQEEEEE
ncbi:MAG: hypothetical protein R6V67_03745 [Spirochaetia bacterium]